MRRTKICVLEYSLVVLYHKLYLQQGSLEQFLSNLLQPFVDMIAFLTALAFALGVLGFIFLILQGVFKWTVGGSFGRSVAVQTFIKAAETLAIIPIIFFISSVLKNTGIEEFVQIAEIMDKLLQRGWDLLMSALG